MRPLDQDMTRPIAQRFAHIRGNLRGRGLLIGDPDLFIAATALFVDGGVTAMMPGRG